MGLGLEQRQRLLAGDDVAGHRRTYKQLHKLMPTQGPAVARPPLATGRSVWIFGVWLGFGLEFGVRVRVRVRVGVRVRVRVRRAPPPGHDTQDVVQALTLTLTLALMPRLGMTRET